MIASIADEAHENLGIIVFYIVGNYPLHVALPEELPLGSDIWNKFPFHLQLGAENASYGTEGGTCW